MTSDDFFLVSVTFGGFLIFALVLWSFARMADRKHDEKRSPDIRPDVEPPSASNGQGRNEKARSGPGKGFPSSSRYAVGAGIVRWESR